METYAAADITTIIHARSLCDGFATSITAKFTKQLREFNWEADMGTAYISTTITAEEGNVFLLETECIAEVEYVIEDGDLSGWHISDFKFTKEQNVWNDTDKVWVRKVIETVWCPDALRPALLAYVDKDKIEEELEELLHSTGEIGSESSASMLSDYHARVM